MPKNSKEELEKALSELKNLDDLIITSLIFSSSLALIARKPAHLGSLGTAYLLGTRKGVYKDYQSALNGQEDTYPGLFGKNETLNNSLNCLSSFFSSAKASIGSSDIPKSIKKIVDETFRKK